MPAPYHLSFGAGARMCTAVNFSNRVLYVLFLRLIVAFQITESKIMAANTDYIHYKKDPAASNAIPSDFLVQLTPRDPEVLEYCLQCSQENAAELLKDEANEVLKR